MCSKIVEHIQDKENMVVIYYFCSSDGTKARATAMLRSLSSQLLAANRTLAPYVLEMFANNGLKPSRKSLGTIVERLLNSLPNVRIVIDGLDECSLEDQEDCLNNLTRIKGAVPDTCKIMVSSRKIPSLTKLLQSVHMIRLEDNAYESDRAISRFIESELEKLKSRFSPDIIDYLQQKLKSKANGELRKHYTR